MCPALTAALSAEDRKPCLFAMVLPDAPRSVMACVHWAMSSRDNTDSGIGPRTGVMSFLV